jgi:hypothetical protein
MHDAHVGTPTGAPAADSSFAGLQARGAVGMGVDQYTSVHTFESRPDGGRITFRRDVEDSAGVETIRAHLREIEASFRAGNFAVPAFIHAGEVPGTDVMAAKRSAITYTFAPIPRGGELVMRTSDPDAIAAIHRFMAFQRMDHRAGGSSDTASARTP